MRIQQDFGICLTCHIFVYQYMSTTSLLKGNLLRRQFFFFFFWRNIKIYSRRPAEIAQRDENFTQSYVLPPLSPAQHFFILCMPRHDNAAFVQSMDSCNQAILGSGFTPGRHIRSIQYMLKLLHGSWQKLATLATVFQIMQRSFMSKVQIGEKSKKREKKRKKNNDSLFPDV